MNEIFFVSLGAILGANARFIISIKLKKLNISTDLYTLFVNTFASFFLGLFISIIERFGSFILSYQLVLFFLIGFLGSLSTFSLFVYDLFNLCLKFKFSRAINLSMISLSMGILAFVFGSLLGNL
tara:strand:+ start:356 stop:730 length:375 start_codon:yes stop_codon:yes gene_type:complete